MLERICPRRPPLTRQPLAPARIRAGTGRLPLRCVPKPSGASLRAPLEGVYSEASEAGARVDQHRFSPPPA